MRRDGRFARLSSRVAPVAQWIERQVADLKVVGSSPAGRATSRHHRLTVHGRLGRPVQGATQARERTTKDRRRTRPAALPETQLYEPVKALLEAQGYVVKGEVRGCDVVGVRGDEPPVVVELKRTFGLRLVHQGIDRLAMTDVVYLAVGAWPSQSAEVRRLCRRLGLGLIVVAGQAAEIVVDPTPYQPRRSPRRRAALLGEHRRRIGDPTGGGSARRPIMTAYRQEAIRCALLLGPGPMSLRAMRVAADVPNAGRIVRDNVYGWFERVDRGIYGLTARGVEAVGGIIATELATVR